ncbi:serine/arginine repetitive matrix protein 2 [Streptomyces agglomeratus]|uniref:Serine/arginine repetitive matrix protein 2 n=1 Tax=Streptomyces agglomeratus TaxID=285458 RepID=A0A1E5P397_9ACTN|nr:EcsC family protein [Streptomyces agglomeratus]OEJ23967.1 serine/arginine repetitive matrix protein 2 [Streptomyces agglomeratus]
MSNPQYSQQPDQLPSDYELDAWRAVQQFKGRPLSRAMRNAGEQVANGVSELGKRAAKQLENHPRAKSALSRGQEAVAKGAQKVGAGARGAADALPDWSGTAAQSLRKTVGRASRAGLSPKRVVALHKKRGHDVESLRDLRRLDLEQVDAVRGRAASLHYPAAAALSGAGAGLVISGGQLAIATSAGAAAAPSGGAIAGAFVADTAVVLGLASRAVGQVSLFYGYDPEEPAEKLFVMSVVNVGTASSATAKNAAMADISRLTQALFRGKAWDVLSDAVVTKVSQQFAKAFGFRLTKKGLGKAVPAFGIVVGSTLNWTTLEGIVDAAEVAYRRRFLLEKYPHLADEEASGSFPDAGPLVPDDADVKISLLSEIVEAGGPDLH